MASYTALIFLPRGQKYLLFNPHILKTFTKTTYFHCYVVFYTYKRVEIEVKYLQKYSNRLQTEIH